MEKKSDCRAGFKHHLTDKYLSYIKRDLMETCRREKLHQVDLLSPAKKKVTDREYWADTRGKIKEGPDFKTRKDMLRSAIEDASSKCVSGKRFARFLKDKYGIVLKISRGRYSYLTPGREKAIRGRTLGTNYTEETLRARFIDNFKTLEKENPEAASFEKLDDISEQKQIREKYHSARDAEKELYTIKKKVDTMLRDPELYADRRRHKTETLE